MYTFDEQRWGMSKIDGTWETITTTAIGDQKATMILKTNGGTLTGTSEDVTGVANIEEGRVDGNTITWSLTLKPMNIKIEGKANIDGDNLSGEVIAAAFGSSSIVGKRV